MGKKKRLKKKSKILFIVLGIFVFIALLGGVYYFVLCPSISLKGGSNVVLTYPKTYKEKGYSATRFGKNLTKDVSVSGKVDSKKIGTYEVVYTVGSGIFSKKVVRKVVVKDSEKPKLEIDDKDVYVCPGSEIVPEEVKATDNYDGDLSKKVEHIISKEKDKITYRVSDSSNNVSEITKKIFYKDIEPPVITLNGDESMTFFMGNEFKDSGVVAKDNCDGDIQNKVKTSGEVNASTPGEYTLTYAVEDSSGNKANASRKVTVRNPAGIVYLTFDDGPNPGTTNVILDILKEEGVKATFFVTNHGPDELIKREYDEGHTVALHTASHDYSIVYASDESYFNDLYSVQDRVKRVTGEESKIIRFPGGSSNTVSRRYSQGIMSRLTQEVVNRGFKYYDWNISSGDAAGGSPTPNDIYSNVVNSLRRDRANMVLMHDIKTYTRDALRDIIRYGKENGYTFERITMDTEMVTQRVNN